MGYSKNLLIVGAGSSVKYDLPLGSELREHILNPVNASRVRAREFNEYLFNRRDVPLEPSVYNRCLEHFQENQEEKTINQIKEFIDDFNKSPTNSIDSYLAKEFSRPDQDNFPGIGKLFIASYIYDKQVAASKSTSNDWIEYMIDRYVAPDYELFFDEPPKIINFNYDTLIEERLRNFLVHLKGHTTDAADEKILDLEIVHVYGQIDSYMESSFSFRFIEDIKTIGDERDEIDPRIKKHIQQAIDSDGKIFVLGFGYNSKNCQILFSDVVPKDKEMIELLTTCHNDYIEEFLHGLASAGHSFNLTSNLAISGGSIVDTVQVLKKNAFLRG